MVIGASWAGARAFTSTAGPGISLMNEFIGLAYYGEVPTVIFDMQRAGPSTGMPTRTQQGDLMLCAYASHGDTRHICLYPADPREAFESAVAAFDLAERFQTPVFVLSDLDIGMNDWMIPKLTWDDGYRPDRGKVLSAAELDEIQSSPATWMRTAMASVSHASGRPREGGVFHARLWSQSLRRLHRRWRGVRRRARSHRPQDPACRPRSAPTSRPHGARSDARPPDVGGCHAACTEALDLLSREGLRSTTCACVGSPSATTWRQFLESHEMTSSSNRTGTRSCEASCCSRPASRRRSWSRSATTPGSR